MPHVIMLAYWFPPCRRWPTAARRAWGFARYLPDHGWRATVIAPDLDAHLLCDCGADHASDEVDGVRVVRVPLPASIAYRATRQLRRDTQHGGATRSVDRAPTVGVAARVLATARTVSEVRGPWPRTAVSTSQELDREPIDAIWTTIPPMESALIGPRLRRHHGVPWVCDLRDPISSVVVPPNASPVAQRALRRLRYRSVLRTADALTAASPGSAELDQRFLERPVSPILSGYTRQPPTSSSPPITTSGPVRMLYVGTLYPDNMAIDVVLDALRASDEGGDPALALDYVGTAGPLIRRAADRAGVGHLVTTRPAVSPDALLDDLAGAHVLLLLEYTVGSTRIPAKLYEYLAAGRPVLAVPDVNPTIRQILARTGRGTVASTPAHVLAAVVSMTASATSWPSDPRQRDAMARLHTQQTAGDLAAVFDRVHGR